jgi:cell wall-associated NlpC family hydrolase
VASPPAVPVSAEQVALGGNDAYQERAVVAERASRAAVRRTTAVRPALARTPRRPIAVVVTHPVRTVKRVLTRVKAVEREVGARPVARTVRHRIRRALRPHRAVVAHRRTVVTKHAVTTRRQRVVRLAGGMTAVIAYARSQVGKRYVTGGEGRGGFDCSGLTKQAYARAGIRLPHSSGAQAARARTISRASARPGDLVIGSGHVGIYMGRGMMIDAGNHRTGVVYRKLYSGLRVARLQN